MVYPPEQWPQEPQKQWNQKKTGGVSFLDVGNAMEMHDVSWNGRFLGGSMLGFQRSEHLRSLMTGVLAASRMKKTLNFDMKPTKLWQVQIQNI